MRRSRLWDAASRRPKRSRGSGAGDALGWVRILGYSKRRSRLLEVAVKGF